LPLFICGQQTRRAHARLYSLICSDRRRTQSQTMIVLIKAGPASLLATNPQHRSRRPNCLDALYICTSAPCLIKVQLSSNFESNYVHLHKPSTLAALPSHHESLHFNALTCINLRPDCTHRLHINNRTLPLCLPSSSSSRVTSSSEVLCMYMCRNQCLLCALKLCGGDQYTNVHECTYPAKPCPQHAHAHIASHRIVTRHHIPNVSQRTTAIRHRSCQPQRCSLSLRTHLIQSQPCDSSTLSVVD
jgi:hypothetical protein